MPKAKNALYERKERDLKEPLFEYEQLGNEFGQRVFYFTIPVSQRVTNRANLIPSAPFSFSHHSLRAWA